MKLTLTPLQLRAIVAAVDYLHDGRPAFAVWTETVLDDEFRARLRMMEAEAWMTETPTIAPTVVDEPARCVGCENATAALQGPELAGLAGSHFLHAVPTKEHHTMAGKKHEVTERPVLVTTAHRGVFFGYADDTSGKDVKLKKARNCVYWSEDVKGFLGLASSGPSAKCRIGPPADIDLRDVTCVAEVTADAAKAWEAAPWR